MKVTSNGVNAKLYANLQTQVNKKGAEMYALNIIQGEIAANDLEFFKTDAGKQYANGLPSKPTKIEDIIREVYGCSKQYFYSLKRLYLLPSEVRAAYEQQETGVKTLEKCLNFAKKSAKGEGDGDGDGDGEGAEVKKEDSLKISVKAGKITIKGSASTSEIDLLISELQRMKQAKSSPKAA